MTMEGYDVEVIHEISNDFYCMICLKLMRNPVQFKCGHGMCYPCHKNLARKSRQRLKEDPTCPQCREVIRDNQVVSNMMFHRLILTLKIRCPSKNNCHWFGELGDLDDHLQGCANGGNAEQAITVQRKMKQLINSESVQNDLLCVLMEQVSSVEKKLNHITSHLHNTDNVSNAIPNEDKVGETKSKVTEPKNVYNYKHGRKKSSTVEKFKQVLNMNHNNFTIYLLCIFVVLFMSIYCLTAAVFHFFNVETTHLKTTYIPKCEPLDQHNQNFASLLNNMLQSFEELKKQVDLRQIQDFLQVLVEIHINDISFMEDAYMNNIQSFYSKQNRTMRDLERHLFVVLERSSQEVNKNITLFDHHARLEASVENVASLQPLLHVTASYLNKKIFTDISNMEYEVVENFVSELQGVKSSLTALQKKVDGLLRNKVLHRELIKPIFNQLNEISKNITKRFQSIDEKKSIQIVYQDTNKMKLKYEALLDGYYANISKAISYGMRFYGVMSMIQNVNLTNGVFVWQINTSSMLNLDKSHAFYSPMFTVIPSTHAMLLLYKDEYREGYWKLTYIQEQHVVVNVRVLIMNHVREEQLLCPESLTGELQDNSTAKINIYFAIPLTVPEMKNRSFIHNDNLLMKVAVSEKD